MGRVYAAHDPTLDREIALKVLHAAAASDPGLEARLVREAKALGRLAPHPEVITVFDAGREGGYLFIAMELVEGGTLRHWCAAKIRSWREVVAVFLRAGGGLGHAHAAGLVHRDFKPDNVLVGADGRIRVTDFGLARPSYGAPEQAEPLALGGTSVLGATVTQTGTLLGTPAYMAPEQLAGQPADVRSDIFSFCVSFYEALYGERPFSAETLGDLAAVTAEGRVARPPPGRAVPARVRRALLVGLRPRPETRYASMHELLAAVRAAVRTPRAPYVAAASIALVSAVAVARPSLFASFERGRAFAPHDDLSAPRTEQPLSEEARVETSPKGELPAATAPRPPAAISEDPPPQVPFRAQEQRPRPAGRSAPRPPSTSPDASLSQPSQAPTSVARPVLGANGAPIIR